MFLDKCHKRKVSHLHATAGERLRSFCFSNLTSQVTSLINEIRDRRGRLGAHLAALCLPSPGLGEEHVRGEVVSSDPLRGDVDLHQLLIVFILQVLIGYIPELITILE